MTSRCAASRGAALLSSTLVLTASLAAVTAPAALADEPVAPAAVEVAPPAEAQVVPPVDAQTADAPAPESAEAPAVAPPPAPEPVAPQNRAPVVADDRLVLVQGSSASLDLLANDEDPDGDALSLLGGTSAGHGTVAFEGGTVTFTADADFVGDDSFLYVAGDGRGGSSPGTVHITVTRAPDAVPAAKPWNVRPAAPKAAPVEVARAVAPQAVAPAAARTVVSRPRPAAPARVPARTAAAPATAVAPMGPSTTPYGAPVARPAALPFTGGPTDVLLPLGAGLLLSGGLLTATGRRRA